MGMRVSTCAGYSPNSSLPYSTLSLPSVALLCILGEMYLEALPHLSPLTSGFWLGLTDGDELVGGKRDRVLPFLLRSLTLIAAASPEGYSSLQLLPLRSDSCCFPVTLVPLLLPHYW